MSVYAVDKLMVETRRLAAEYHKLTGQVLPVSGELARYDVEHLLGFTKPEIVESGVDLVGTDAWKNLKVQVKSRVIFEKSKSRQKVGQLNFDGKWDVTVLVLFNEHYETVEMYLVTRDTLLKSLSNNDAVNTKKTKGAISVNKFKSIGEMVWGAED